MGGKDKGRQRATGGCRAMASMTIRWETIWSRTTFNRIIQRRSLRTSAWGKGDVPFLEGLTSPGIVRGWARNSKSVDVQIFGAPELRLGSKEEEPRISEFLAPFMGEISSMCPVRVVLRIVLNWVMIPEISACSFGSTLSTKDNHP